MAYRLIALDLDGTLLDPLHRISEANRRAVRECVDQGALVVIASGRLFASVRPYCLSLGLTGSHVALNGAVTADVETGATSSALYLTESDVDEGSRAFDAVGVPSVIFGRDSIYTTALGDHCKVLESFGEPSPLLVPALTSGHVPDPVKVVGFVSEGSNEEALVRSKVAGRLDVVRTGALFLELMVPGVTKGAALTRLMAQHGIPRAQVLAVGDNFNDLSMFAVAGFSVAMASAPPPVRERASAVTSHCTEDGVAAALTRFVLNPGRSDDARGDELVA